MEQVPHQQAHEVARRRAGKRGIDPGGGAGPHGGHGVGGLARQRLAKAAAAARPWRRRCKRGRRAGGGAVRAVARAEAAARARGGGAREQRPQGRGGAQG